jgi:hypothetical protein
MIQNILINNDDDNSTLLDDSFINYNSLLFNDRMNKLLKEIIQNDKNRKEKNQLLIYKYINKKKKCIYLNLDEIPNNTVVLENKNSTISICIKDHSLVNFDNKIHLKV